MSKPLRRPQAAAARLWADMERTAALDAARAREARPCTEPCDGTRCARPFCGLPEDTWEEA